MDRGSDLHKNKSLERPPKISFGRKILNFMWNKQNKTCCTRTPVNWTSITIYYICFVGVLAGIFMLTVYSVEAFLGEGATIPNFPLGGSPDLDFVPLLQISSPLILVSASDKKQNEGYITKIDQFIKSYKGKESSFDPSTFGECATSPYGYDSSFSPCVYLRLNRVLNWVPQGYSADVKFPTDMPKDVQDKIKESKGSDVFVYCRGTYPKDRQHLKSDSFVFAPQQSFPSKFFPYKKKKDYVDPAVAVKIPVPPQLKGIVSGVTCKVWAKNMDPDNSGLEVIIYISD